MKTEYDGLIEAAKVICAARLEVKAQDGTVYVSPAWKMLSHAEDYLLKLANDVFRAEEVRS